VRIEDFSRHDDSGFRTLFVNRLDDARREEDEGCAVHVSAIER